MRRYKTASLHIPEQFLLALRIFPAGSSLIHVRSGSHPENWLLYVIAFEALLEHAYPKVIVLGKKEVLITTRCFNRTLLAVLSTKEELHVSRMYGESFKKRLAES